MSRTGPGIAALLTVVLAGCDAPSVTTNQVLEPEESRQKVLLTADEQAAIRRTFKDTAADLGAGRNRPRAAPMGVRWPDVPAAVACACDADGVEMAIVSTSTDKGRSFYVFTLKTVEDFPATLEVTRTGDERVYAATATVGVYGSRIERAEALLAALHLCMQQFGVKPRFDEQ